MPQTTYEKWKCFPLECRTVVTELYSWNFIADFTATSMLTTGDSHSLYSLDSMAVKFLLIILFS